MRYLLNGHSYTATACLKFYFFTDLQFPFIKAMLLKHGHTVKTDRISVLIKYFKSLDMRPPVRIDSGAIESLLTNQDSGGISEGDAKKLASLLQALLENNPSLKAGQQLPLFSTVIPAGTITGRDSTKGMTLNSVSKKHWKEILSPPLGGSYVLLDYSSQELVIAAVKARDKNILALYKQGDLYDALSNQVTNGELSRDTFKSLIIKIMYGQTPMNAAEELGINKVDAFRWVKKLKTITKLLDNFLDEQACNAYSIGEIRSLDWRMSVDSETNFLTLRNWPIQSCGADILHRGCIALHASSIPVLLTNHDSFLILVDDKNAKETILLAERLLLDASAEVLDGYQLKIKIELIVGNYSSDKE